MDGKRSRPRQRWYPQPGEFFKITPLDPGDTSTESSQRNSSASPEPVIVLKKRRTHGHSYELVGLSRPKRARREGDEDDTDTIRPSTLSDPMHNGTRPRGTQEADNASDQAISETQTRPRENGARPDDDGAEDTEANAEGSDGEPIVPATGSGPRAEADEWLRASGMRRKLLTRAQANLTHIGSYEVARQWKRTMEEWRATSILLQVPASGHEVTPEEHSAALGRRAWLAENGDWDREFVALYDRVKRTNVVRDISVPQGRLKMADLAARYMLLKGDAKAVGPKPSRTVAKEEMFSWLYGNNAPTGRWGEFTRELKYWRRWKVVTSELPKGILALWPKQITTSFIQQELNDNEIRLWLQAVKQFCPDMVELGKAATPLLLDILEGREPPPNRLRLEVWDESAKGLQDLEGDWFGTHVVVPRTPSSSQEQQTEQSSEFGSWTDDDVLI